MLTPALAFAALLIGLTGAWSPCGFSMVETIGLAGDRTRRRTTVASCATFVPGAIVGGVLTFGTLAVIGHGLHGGGGTVAYVAAAAVALAGAAAEAAGVRIAPQIRRQLPESWRWTMPLPLASALYGVLLGLGFTTFVLSFGVWALAGISLAVGDPLAGLVIGAGFGIGRAIPIVVVAPFVDTRFGVRCIELMAGRPSLYRAFRIGDAVTLGLVAVALAAGTATASRTEVPDGADPSAAAKQLAFQKGDRGGMLRSQRGTVALPGRDPGLGGPYAATISSGGDRIDIIKRSTLKTIGTASVRSAEAVAVSDRWLVYLTANKGRYFLQARRIGGHPRHLGEARKVASIKRPSAIGRPSIRGDRVVFALSRRHTNAIVLRSLKTGKGGKVLRSRTAELLNPSLLGDRMLYVMVRRGKQSPQNTSPRPFRQELMLKRMGSRGKGNRIYKRGSSRTLWTTALSKKRAFVTLLGGNGPKIVSVKR
jgi:hypothetical protein